MAQKVFLLPRKLTKNEEEIDYKLNIVTLKCSKTGNPAKYIFDDRKNQLLEILQFQGSKNSWFIDNSVEKDGLIYVATPIDPLFLILPYLKEEIYSPLDQVFIDENFPDSKILSQCCLNQIDLITDRKDFGKESVYKYNEQKTIDWLKFKFEMLVSLLKEKEIDCTNGSKVTSLITSKKKHPQQLEKINKYASGIISQYLDDKLNEKFLKALKICDDTSPEECPEKKARKTDFEEPLENYFDQFNYNHTKTTKVTKLTASQKKLMKVDKKVYGH